MPIVNALKLVVIAGIRSQHVKMAAIQRAVEFWNRTRIPRVSAVYVNAGQHYDDILSRNFIDELGVRYDIDLTSTHFSRRPIEMLSSMLVALYDLLVAPRYADHYAIVFGDANTTLAGALAATKAGIPLAHVESGVRVGKLTSEEINRVVADCLATVRFASTHADYGNLMREGLGGNAAFVGDVIYDLVLALRADGLEQGACGLDSDYIFASLHRDENLMLPGLLETLLIALDRSGRETVFLTHPRTAAAAEDIVGTRQLRHVRLTHGLSYRGTLAAIGGCRFLVTDSGAFQRESFYLRKRCVIRQDRAFWHTLVEHGVHIECGTTLTDISSAIAEMDSVAVSRPYPEVDDFGDGTAGHRIIEKLQAFDASRAVRAGKIVW